MPMYMVELAYAVRDTYRRVGGGSNADQHYKNMV